MLPELELSQLVLKGKKIMQVRFELGNAPLLILKLEDGEGYVACGYISREAAEKLGDTAAFVSGVKTFEEVLNAKVKAVSSNAAKKGVKEGMSGREALEKMSE